MAEKVKIFLVDDHRVVLEGIKSALREHPQFRVTGEALNGREAVRRIKALKPDIVIMDISMPDLNGIDATLQIKKFDPRIRIIIFTMYSNIEYMIDLFNAKVSAYVLKEDPMSDLMLAIETVHRGGIYFGSLTPAILSRHREALAGSKVSRDNFSTLSLREREIFQLLAEGESIKAIAAKLGISPKTVESHKYKIMDKLSANTLTDLTRIAIRKKIIEV